MRPAIPLRGKILLITVVPLVSLALGTLWTVNRSVERRAHDAVRDDLSRASALLEHLVDARARSLDVAGEVVVRDPRFFSVLTLPGSSKDPQIRATVAGVASDFNSVTRSDLFEVYGRDGRCLAATGSAERPGGRAEIDPSLKPLVTRALTGHAVAGVLALREAHYQLSVTPVTVDGRVVGALLLGSAMGQEFAGRLKDLTRSEVTFVAGLTPRGSTFEREQDLDATLASLSGLGRISPSYHRGPFEVRGPEHVWLTLVRRVPGSPEGVNQFYALQRALDVETAYLRDIQSHLLSIGVAAVLLAILAGVLIAGRIVSPVRRLVRGAEEMERGNYDYPLEVRSRDEIGYLAERFREMRAHQRTYVNSLEEVMRVKSEFISIASHELRTPITILRGFQELMEQEALGPVTDAQRRALQGMDRSLTDLTRIAEDATRMSQIESEELQLRLGSCDLAELVAGAVRAARAAAPGRRVELIDHTAADIGTVEVDGQRVAQAIGNLLQNGIRFTPDGGRVEIEARREPEWIVVTVSDTGLGIPEEKLRRLESTAPIREATHHHSSGALEFNSAGLGLGLAIARGIVRAHGGELRIESEDGRGTRVTLRVPARVASEERRAA